MRTPRSIPGLEGPFYRVSEIALALGVDPTTVLRWIHAGELEAERMNSNGGMFLVPQRALDRRRANDNGPGLALATPAGA
jgi:excisionase family DNA binding protein